MDTIKTGSKISFAPNRLHAWNANIDANSIVMAWTINDQNRFRLGLISIFLYWCDKDIIDFHKQRKTWALWRMVIFWFVVGYEKKDQTTANKFAKMKGNESKWKQKIFG